MFFFPFIYLISFLVALAGVLKKKIDNVLLFFIFGLPIYTTALSLTLLYGLVVIIPVMQSFKELIVLLALCTQLYLLKQKLKLHLVDKLVFAYLLYTFLYVLLPVGSFGFTAKLLAMKGIAFFTLVYFLGRLLDLKTFYLNRYFYFICAVSIGAALVLAYEVFTYTHLQTHTGYADYNFYFFNREPDGNYGLSFTFETENGLKRFASFFSNPLENSASNLLTIAVLAGLYTRNNNKIVLDKFGMTVLCCTFFSIFASLSRSSFASYFALIYFYALLTRKKYITQTIHAGILAAVVYLFFFIQDKGLQEFLINTVNFSNGSSVGHLIEWLDGINAMMLKPLGMGLGESGRVAIELGQNVGGENQFLIIGVQTGIIGMGLYAVIYVLLMKIAWKWFHVLKGREKKLCLALLLIKIGFLLPLLTSELESSTYLSYMTWFFSGLLINIVSQQNAFLSSKENYAAEINYWS